jgi:hypothetical protein
MTCLTLIIAFTAQPVVPLLVTEILCGIVSYSEASASVSLSISRESVDVSKTDGTPLREYKSREEYSRRVSVPSVIFP